MQGQTIQRTIHLSPLLLLRRMLLAGAAGVLVAAMAVGGMAGSAAGPAGAAAYASIIAGTMVGLTLLRERPVLEWVLRVIAGGVVRMLVSVVVGGAIVLATRVDPRAFWMCFLAGSAAVLVAETAMVTIRLKAATA